MAQKHMIHFIDYWSTVLPYVCRAHARASQARTGKARAYAPASTLRLNMLSKLPHAKLFCVYSQLRIFTLRRHVAADYFVFQNVFQFALRFSLLRISNMRWHMAADKRYQIRSAFSVVVNLYYAL